MTEPFLKLIIGPMFSGKSTELIKLIRKFKCINKRIFVVKPQIDVRYDKMNICTHNLEKETCHITNDLNTIKKHSDYSKAEVIIIEEGQFFDNLYEFVTTELENKKSFIIAGLDGDYKRQPFGDMLNLIPLSDEITKLSALCKECCDGTQGIFTKKIIVDDYSDNVIEVGGEETYIPVCRKHFK
jgi:thymidine kinase